MASEFIKDFNITDCDLNRPWGEFYYIDDNQTDMFIKKYFPDLNLIDTGYLVPKILVINPNQRLSWQYHHKRTEIWSILKGPVGVISSLDDTQSNMKVANVGDIIWIEPLERHRIVGLNETAVVAEIWWHSNKSDPSDEFDIVRLDDDYKR